jgi:hypothetical protein
MKIEIAAATDRPDRDASRQGPRSLASQKSKRTWRANSVFESAQPRFVQSFPRSKEPRHLKAAERGVRPEITVPVIAPPRSGPSAPWNAEIPALNRDNHHFRDGDHQADEPTWC